MKGSNTGYGWGNIRTQISDVLQTDPTLFSGFNIDSLTGNMMDLTNAKGRLVSDIKQIRDHLQRVGKQVFPWDDGGMYV